jgi:hypothetical protein
MLTSWLMLDFADKLELGFELGGEIRRLLFARLWWLFAMDTGVGMPGFLGQEFDKVENSIAVRLCAEEDVDSILVAGEYRS